MSVQESSHDQMIGVFVLGNFDNVPNVTCGYLSIPKLCMRDTNFKIIVDFFCKCNFYIENMILLSYCHHELVVTPESW